jgi:hypothetical protein
MKRNYISPEYNNVKVYGTYNMMEESNFFASKMLEIEDTIQVGSQDVIYYQSLSGEQLDHSIESSLQSYIYSPSSDKLANHTLIIDDSQPLYQKDNNARWIITIQLDKILKNFIFAEMKKYRTFEGVKKEMTIYNDVDVAMKNYIDWNVYDRYKLTNVDLYVSYNFLREQNLLRFKNKWNSSIISESNKLTKFQTETATDNSSIRLFFNQEKTSEDYSFDYFFNVNFEKV